MKAGDKYILEIAEVIPIEDGNKQLARIKGFNALVFDQIGLNKLEKLEDAAKKVGKEPKKDPLKEILEYCESLKLTAMGKDKVLEYLSKFIKAKMQESRI